ncbi:MAG TPA: hypothetical protein VJ583_10495 [Nitrososphaeraceae archaeon]|nr:hypothetical protein [Nitrososphaeraceae archaeon]
MNKHYGNAFLVTYIDYLVGRQSGLYPHSSPPNYQTKMSPLHIFNEFWKEKARIVARGNSNL